MDTDKILTYLIAISTVVSLLTGSAKNIHDMRVNKKKRRTPAKKKRRK